MLRLLGYRGRRRSYPPTDPCRSDMVVAPKAGQSTKNGGGDLFHPRSSDHPIQGDPAPLPHLRDAGLMTLGSMGDRWSTGLMPDKLPKGWSWPIKPSEVEKYFPGVGHTYWFWGSYRLRNRRLEEVRPPSFRLDWTPRSAMPQPVLTVFSVPSDKRASVRAWVEAVVAPQAHAWLGALETQYPTWLDARHQKTWTWKEPDRN